MSTGSMGRKGTSGAGADNEVHQLRMEAQFLRWEKDLLAKKLEAMSDSQLEVFPSGGNKDMPDKSRRVHQQVDSDVEWLLPEETSGYVSGATGQVSSPGMVPETVSKSGKASFVESTPLKQQGSGMFSRAKLTPIVSENDGQVNDDLTLFFSGQGGMGQVQRSTNPFLREREVVTPKQVRSELLGFATRPGEARGDSLAGKVDSSSVGPWPLRRESRVCSDDGQRESLERPSRRPNITPDRYSGKVLWKEYYRHFESCREVNRWNDEQAARYLAASLQGDALRLLGDSGQQYTYGVLVKLLERRFGSGRQSENYLVELRYRRQKPKETLQELGQAIHELTVRAYPEIVENARDRLARNHFLDAVNSQSVREGINRARPSNLDEAIQAALETENFEMVEQQRVLDRKPAKLARATDSGVEQRLGTVERSLSEQKQTLEIVTGLLEKLTSPVPSQSGVQSKETHHPPKVEGNTWRCFNCGKEGHFARHCKNPRRKPPRMQGNANQPHVGPAGRLDCAEGPNDIVVTGVVKEERDKSQGKSKES